MSADPRRVIVTESCCQACDVHTVYVHHESLPEFRVEGRTAEQAAGHLAERLTAALDNASDPWHGTAVKTAIGDIRAFIDRQEPAHIARDV